ncbi:MAG: hypothetical protein ACT4R6_06945 [Gemmatimonadaceae bacterium]
MLRAASATDSRVPLRSRLIVALVFAVVGAAIAYRAQFILNGNGGDLYVTWRAAHIIAAGDNPYEVIKPFAGWTWNTYWFYPLPAALLAAPVMTLQPATAALVFVAGSGALLGFALAGSRLPWFPLLVSVPFWFSAQLAQMTPAILALGLLPAVAGLTVLKPTLAFSLFAWRPSWRSAVVAAATLVLSVVIFPWWPAGWLDAIAHSTSHGSPATRGIGAAGLLGLLRWRRPEARLLVCYTLAPNAMWFYDELLLFLVARTPRESIGLCVGSWLAWTGWLLSDALRGVEVTLLHAGPWIAAGLIVPATFLVLRRPNEGALPDRLERLAARLPARVRGVTSSRS